MKALSLHVTGIVQGVGFRPFIYHLALEQGLTGWVLNASDGVYLVIEGDDGDCRRLRAADPRPRARHGGRRRHHRRGGRARGVLGIRDPRVARRGGRDDARLPDTATCPDCLAELFSEGDRRYRYPFINCTNCGPRFTIIGDVPYDRPMTSMRDFPMCPECAEEYGDPGDRRFHAQPDACFICGPRLYLNTSPGAAVAGGIRAQTVLAAFGGCGTARGTPGPAAQHVPRCTATPSAGSWSPEVEVSPRPHRDRDAEAARSDAILAATTELLLDGRIVAIKGLGGFHLACDATNAEAVATLRERKRRWGKPLAIMVRDVEAARAYCQVNEAEAELLSGTARPIVLLRRLQATTPDASGGRPGGATRVPQPPKAARTV